MMPAKPQLLSFSACLEAVKGGPSSIECHSLQADALLSLVGMAIQGNQAGVSLFGLVLPQPHPSKLRCHIACLFWRTCCKRHMG